MECTIFFFKEDQKKNQFDSRQLAYLLISIFDKSSIQQIDCQYLILHCSSIEMKNSQTLPFLSRMKKQIDSSDDNQTTFILAVKQDKCYSKPKMHRIAYPPLFNYKSKENNRQLLLQSYIEKKRYEDIWDQTNQKKIKIELGPSEQGSRKTLQPINCIGKDATLRYYNEYKILNKMLLKKEFNSSALLSTETTPKETIQSIQSESPSISMLEKTDILKVLPLCLGLVKDKGEANVLNISNYNLGDRYIISLAAGLRKSKIIQKCYMSANRITDIGLDQLVQSINSQVTVLDLSHNKITKVSKRLLQIILEADYRLQQLNLGNNMLKEQSVESIFRNGRYSRHLRSLNMNNNKLTINCLDSLADMIEKSTTLQQLYIGGNYLSSKAGQRIFHLLAHNKNVKVLDYSLNQLGEDPELGCSKAIALCFKSNKSLEHVDLSFNNIGKQSTQIIAEGLQPNKHIYGLHFRGNYGYVNSKGFLILEEKQVTLLHSIEKQRMNGYQITSNRERNAFKSQIYKNVCWICEGWYQNQFKLCVPQSSGKILVYIHFDFERYEPRLIAVNEHQVRYTTMVPPKKYRYFFTINKQIYLDQTVLKERIPLLEIHSYEMEHAQREFKVENVNYGEGKTRKIANEWNQIIVKSIPRTNGLMTKKEKIPWKYERSAWAKEWKLEDEQLLRKCFDRDWKQSKLMNLIKNQGDQQKVKEILWKYYATIKNLYKQFASWSPFGDVWAVSNQPFTEFCQLARIINKDTPLKIIDLTFITTNSMSSADWKGNSLNPERGLVRFQFMQSLVRLAEEKFKKNSVVDTFNESISLLFKDYVEPLSNQYNSNQWRLQKYFVQYNDTLIKKYRPIFSAIYKRNSKLKLKPGQKPFMCLIEFKSIIERAGLSNYITERDTFISFNTAMMTHVDELQSQRFTKMTEIQFIEGMARCSNVLPNQCCISNEEGPTPLHKKFEWMIHQIKAALCPEDIRTQFPDPETSMFNEQQEQ